MAVLLTELDTRWQSMFDCLASGDDVAPGFRLRTEGIMEAAALTGEVTQAEIYSAMAAAYQAAFSRSLELDFDANWREFFPFPQIPAMAKRAPVYPSTPD